MAQENGCNAATAMPESFERADTITRETDVFAFGMVVKEVRSCATLRRWFVQRLNPAQGFCGEGYTQ